MRYAYSVTAALLAGGAALSLAGFPAGAQIAQNEESRMASVVPRTGAPANFADLAEHLQPAVVNISTRQRIEVSRGEGQSLGSGFFISADGYVVTNNHVISPSGRGTVEEITVTLPDGAEYKAELIGSDPQSDLAVLKVNRSEPFPFVKFGDSSQSRVGDWVVAIGNPFGLGGTVTSGIISSVLRTAGGGAYNRYIQTDAAINRGNSGGPLFDMKGNVIGINSNILSPTGGNIGIGFAIPAETAAPIVEKLRSGVEIERGFLGVQIAQVTEDMADSLGLEHNRGEFIHSVQPGQPADRAGLEAGDIVVSVGGKAVTPDQTLSYLIADIAPGTSVPLEVYRNGERRKIKVTVGKRPSDEELRQSQMFAPDVGPEEEDMAPSENVMVEEKLGLQLVPINPNIARQLGVSADTQGLAIASVDPNSDAARKGLQRRDIILTANYRPVTTIADLENIIRSAQAKKRDAVLLRVLRAGSPPQYVAVRLSSK